MHRLIPPAAAAGALLAVAAFAVPVAAQANGPFENCPAAYAAGRANIPKGDPAYAEHLDGTGPGEPDGIACENPPPGFKPYTPAPATTATPTTKAPTTAPSTTRAPVRATPKFTG